MGIFSFVKSALDIPGGPSQETKRKRAKEEFDFQKDMRLYKYDPNSFEYGQPAKADFTSLDFSNANQTRAEQKSLIDALRARVAGSAPSVAEQQLKQGQDAAVANIVGSMAANRGVNPAVAARQAAMGIASAAGDVNRQAALLRADEQSRAENLLGSILQGARSADETRAVSAGQLEQQTRLANLQALMDALARRQQGRVTLEQLRGGDMRELNANLLAGERAKAERDSAMNRSIVGGLFSAGGSVLGSMLGGGGK